MLTALLYVSGFCDGDAEYFGPGFVATFAAHTLAQLEPGELDALCRALTNPDLDNPYRLADCQRAADLIAPTLA